MTRIEEAVFCPAWWLPGSHFQTIWPSLFRSKPQLKRTRERFVLSDGDFVDLDWEGQERDEPLILILHGLTGSSNSSYAIGLQGACKQRGFRSVVLNFRGCSGEHNLQARSYHSGDTGDINEVFLSLLEREPDTIFFASGYSLGGNVLLKWLGEQGDNSQLRAATASSVPFLLGECSSRIEKGFSRVYLHAFIRSLHRSFLEKKKYLRLLEHRGEVALLEGLGDISKHKSFWSFDNEVTAPLHGFRDVHDYYNASSSKPLLKRIKIPTLLLQSSDDPFMSKAVLPTEEDLSQQVRMKLTKKGGHVGFVTGWNPFRPKFWLDEQILAFFEESLR